MRTAICISGHVRNWEYTFPNFKEYLYDPHAAKGNVDIFISTWDSAWTKDCWSPQYRFKNTIFDKIMLQQTYTPKEIVIENYNDLKPRFLVSNFTKKQREMRGISNEGVLFSTPMYYKIWSANQLKKNHEQKNGFIYDRVIRYRFDLWFKMQIEHLLGEDPKCIYTKWFNNNSFADDAFACGPSNLMDIYSDIYINLGKVLDFAVGWGPEKLLYRYLNECQIKMSELPPQCFEICRKESRDMSKGISGENL